LHHTPFDATQIPGLRSRQLRHWSRILVTSLILAATGCAPFWPPERAPQPTIPQPPPVAEQAPEPEPEEPAELTAQELQTIRNLLEQAYWSMAADRLTFPYPGSALSAYDEVLRLQPDNDEARHGRDAIVERYLEQALAAAARRNFAEAQGMLDRATLVDPDHPGVAPTQTQIDLRTAADRRVVQLDPAKLREQHADVAASLRQAGATSRSGDCRVEIFARSDAEGRWIYQQMSGASAGKRISAQLSIGSPPRVELLCFTGAG
jgi:tetratricopeptide (TPR) repeat protein